MKFKHQDDKLYEDRKEGYQLKAEQFMVKPFVVSLSNHERPNHFTLRQALGERLNLAIAPL